MRRTSAPVAACGEWLLLRQIPQGGMVGRGRKERLCPQRGRVRGGEVNSSTVRRALPDPLERTDRLVSRRVHNSQGRRHPATENRITMRTLTLLYNFVDEMF